MPQHHAKKTQGRSGAKSATKPLGPSQRQLRIGELIRKSLSEVFTRSDIRDDDLVGTFITVSEVRVSPDARNATAYVMPLGGKNQEVVVEALRRHSRFIRGEMARMIELKYVPELRFETDPSFDASERIDQVLRSPEVARDLKSPDLKSPE